MILELDPGNQRLLNPTPDLGVYFLPTISIARTVSKMEP